MTIKAVILQNLKPMVDDSARVYVGFSGGVDSTALLHVLADSPEWKYRVTAIHVHHGLSQNADAWLGVCEQFCQQCSIPLIKEFVSVSGSKKGLEAEAREARLEKFASHLKPGDVLLTAHHLNDQAETFFYRLFRGAGVQGLSSIKNARPLGLGKLLRPMLNIKRLEIEKYASQNELKYVDDESNLDSRFDRNFIRNELVPVIASRWPSYDKTVVRAVEHLQQSKTLIDEYLDQDLSSLGFREEKVGHSVCLKGFIEYSEARQHAVFRRWCERLAYNAPEAKLLSEIKSLLIARDDAEPCLRWGGVQLRRYKNRLYLLPVLNKPSRDSLDWGEPSALDLGSGFKLRRSLMNSASEQAIPQLHVSFGKASLRCRPLERRHSQSVKKLLQEYGVEPWLRPFVPMIYVASELIAVGDYWQCDASFSFPGLRFEWSYHQELHRK